MAYALCFIHALTSVHAGTGQGTDAIDLPISRERSTTLPLIPGSSLKGCLRDAARALTAVERKAIFGPDRDHAADNAGAISVGDGQLALFPVRSLSGTFVWATSPFLLARVQRDATMAKISEPPARIPAVVAGEALVSDSLLLLAKLGNRLVLEEQDFEGKPAAAAVDWATWFAGQIFPAAGDAAFHLALRSRLVILDDRTLFALARTATEVQAHITLDPNTGTVQPGALWYQESLPAETVLVGVVRAAKPRFSGSDLETDDAVFQRAFPASGRIQVGGKAGTGQGWVRIVRAGGAA